jgi:putative membrane protein
MPNGAGTGVRARRRSTEDEMTRSFMVVGLLSFTLINGPVLAAADLSSSDQAKPEQTKPDPPKSPAATGQSADANFMRESSMSNLAEIEHGRLAAQNASSEDVKKFAERMVADHSKANDELKTIAATKNVTLPTELDQKHQAMQDKLAKIKAEAFDKAYMSHMVTSHEQAVGRFKRESQNGKDADVKAFAEKTLPTVEEHLKMARELSAKVAKKTV